MNRIPELDGLRALSVGLVIGCHYQAFAVLFGGLPRFGWVGVEVFFVLSGYLITTILLSLRHEPHAYRTFYARRVRRIFPPYLITVFLCFFFAFALTFHVDWKQLVLEVGFLRSFVHSRAVFLSAIHNIQTGSVPSVFKISALRILTPSHSQNLEFALGPTWSLSVEEWFYIIWAPLVLALGRRGIIAGSLTAVILGILLRWTSGVAGITWYTDFYCSFDQLSIGALLALWFNVRPQLAPQRRLLVDRLLSGVGIAALAGLCGILFRVRPFVGREIRDATIFGAAGITLIGIVVVTFIAYLLRASRGPSPLARLFRLPPLVWIGRRSYTIYLAHLPLYWVVCTVLGTTGGPTWTSALLALVLTIATAALSWAYIEEPLLRKRSLQPVPVHLSVPREIKQDRSRASRALTYGRDLIRKLSD